MVHWGLVSRDSFPLPIAIDPLKGPEIPTAARLLPDHSLPNLMGQRRGTCDHPLGTLVHLVSKVFPHDVLQRGQILTAQLLQGIKKKLLVFVGLPRVTAVRRMGAPPAGVFGEESSIFHEVSAARSVLLAPAVADSLSLKKPVSSLSSAMPKPSQITPH